MTPRIHASGVFTRGAVAELSEGPSRHLQVLRLQPGDAVGVFDGTGREWQALIEQIGRKVVTLRIGDEIADAGGELACRVTLAFGVPANDRMDALVEKATELGVHAIQPLLCERSVLRLKGERNDAKQRHWAAIAVAASEQCGRRVVPNVAPQSPLDAWLQSLPAFDPNGPERRWMLSLAPNASAPNRAGLAAESAALRVLSGPEGGLAAAEEALAIRHGFVPVGLGPRVLRADTAPLALLAWFGVATLALR